MCHTNTTKFFAVLMDAEIAANMAYFYTMATKRKIFFIYILPQAADKEAEA